MLIHPWDAAVDDNEWQEWLSHGERFGTLAVPNLTSGAAPILIPTHFTIGDNELLLHLARPNPVWEHLTAAAQVRLAVTTDYAYVPSTWRAADGAPPEHGVPTSYYASVQFLCTATIVDDPAEKASILRRQLADVQPEGGHGEVSDDAGPYARMLAGIRGLRLTIVEVEAKFKYDDHKPLALRKSVQDNLEQRDRGLDRGAARQQRRRIAATGDWDLRRG